jgi:superfamily II DNA or RNA helicase
VQETAKATRQGQKMTEVLAQRVCDDGSKFPAPRPFQLTAHEQLRAGFRAGHKNQLIMAPTGAGKTYLGLRICNEAMQKGKRAVFLCDRTTLINQTSEAADGYGLNDFLGNLGFDIGV